MIFSRRSGPLVSVGLNPSGPRSSHGEPVVDTEASILILCIALAAGCTWAPPVPVWSASDRTIGAEAAAPVSGSVAASAVFAECVARGLVEARVRPFGGESLLRLLASGARVKGSTFAILELGTEWGIDIADGNGPAFDPRPG